MERGESNRSEGREQSSTESSCLGYPGPRLNPQHKEGKFEAVYKDLRILNKGLRLLPFRRAEH